MSGPHGSSGGAAGLCAWRRAAWSTTTPSCGSRRRAPRRSRGRRRRTPSPSAACGVSRASRPSGRDSPPASRPPTSAPRISVASAGCAWRTATTASASRRAAGPAGPWRSVFSVAGLSEPGNTASLDWFFPSPDGRFAAVGISWGGDEQCVLRLLDVERAELLPVAVPDTWFARVAWLPDSGGCYFPTGDFMEARPRDPLLPAAGRRRAAAGIPRGRRRSSRRRRRRPPATRRCPRTAAG